MKEGIGLKRLPAMFIALLFVLAGCSTAEPTTVTIDRSFRCPIAVEQKGLHFEAELTVTPEQCAAVFSRPEAVNGLTMTCRSGRVSVRYGKDPGETPLPEARQCFLFWLSRALTQSDAAVSRKENAFTLQGAIDGQKYLLTVDGASGQPLFFEMEPLDLTVKFQTGE